MLVCYPSLRTVEKPSERRGYWDPKVFPTVAAFASLSKPDQTEVVVTCKRIGFRFAVELVPKSAVTVK